MKRPLVLASVLSAASLLAAGSASATVSVSHKATGHVAITPAAPKKGTVTISLYNYYGTGNQAIAIKEAISAFEKRYPTVKVVNDIVSGNAAAAQKLITLESANKTPNVIAIDQDYLYEFYPRLLPLKTFFPANFLNKFDAGGLKSATYAGTEYGLQVLGANDTALIYNKTDFAHAGIKAPPKTWAQLLADAKKLTVPSAKRYGFGVSGTQTEESSWQFEPFLWSNGGTLAHLSAPPAVQALTFWQQLVKDGVMPNATASWTQQDVENHFAVNDLAMEINGPWNVPCLQQPATCLGSSSSGAPAKINYGVAPIPTRLPKQKLIVPIGGETWEIGQGTTAQEAASALLLQYLTNDTALNVRLTHEMGYMPAIKTESAAFDHTYPAYAVFASELVNGLPRQYGKGEYGAVSALLQVAIGKALTLSESPKAALQTAASGVASVKPA